MVVQMVALKANLTAGMMVVMLDLPKVDRLVRWRVAWMVDQMD